MFYASGSDPYLPWLPDGTRASYWSKIQLNNNLVFQVLPKEGPGIERLDEDTLPDEYQGIEPSEQPRDNVMLDITVEPTRSEYRLMERKLQTKCVQGIYNQWRCR